jgi:phosphomannomutase
MEPPRRSRTGRRRALRIVYTALHGVGDGSRDAIARSRGLHERALPVAEQAEPDGAFPTVASPTPRRRARWISCSPWPSVEGADLVLANDPDADRLAVAVRGSETASYVQLTGNEVGVPARALPAHERRSSGSADKPVVVSSLVSSPMLGAIAGRHGARYWGDAHRLQVDRQPRHRPRSRGGPRLRVRLRGGARLHGGHGGARQGRPVSAALVFAELFAARHAEGRRRCSTSSTSARASTAST